MTIEVVAIATEVLSGFTVNTNAAFISRELFKKGLTVSRHTVLPDEDVGLREGLKEVLKRSSIVIATGGLGPTLDDPTRKIVADLFQMGFRYDEEVAADLVKRYGADLPTLTDQATVPEAAQVLLNTVGTAPGLVLKSPTTTLILMPGVPMEMKPMMTGQVLPLVEKLLKDSVRIHQRSLHLFSIPESSIDPTLRMLKEKYPSVEFGIYPGQGTLTIHLRCQSSSDETAQALLEKPFQVLCEQFNDNRFEASNGKIEEAIHHIFLKNGLTLSLAESCTGGSIAAHLTQYPGASGYFLGSLVCYSNALKNKILDVPETVLQHYGAVSSETARLMALGAQKITGSDYALAVTGIAGPSGGTFEKPVGTVYGAIAKKNGEVHDIPLFIPRSREIIIERSKNLLLSELLIFCSK